MSEVKMNLHCNNQSLKGYDNYESRQMFIDEQAGIKASMDRYLFGNVNDNSVDEIIINLGCLGSLHRQEVVPTLAAWFRILKPGSRLRMVFQDLYVILTAVQYDQVNHLEFEQTFVQYNSYHTMKEVMELTEAAGFILGEAMIGMGNNDYVGCLEVLKPKTDNNDESG